MKIDMNIDEAVNKVAEEMEKDMSILKEYLDFCLNTKKEGVSMNRCGNCGYYPFCTQCESAIGWCDKWVEREVK